jgi:hypothetical protein
MYHITNLSQASIAPTLHFQVAAKSALGSNVNTCKTSFVSPPENENQMLTSAEQWFVQTV